MKVVVLGGGVAGLSAGWVLSKNGIDVTVLEKEDSVGGLARSFKRNGYTYDLGGHRFFTKNNQLVDVIKDILGDNLLVMPRNSSIYMQGRFFEYPPKIFSTLTKMPLKTSMSIVVDYIKATVSHRMLRKKDTSFESWIKNRFGKTFYDIYFGPYTAKTWGTHPSNIAADWAAQRISVVSLWDAVKNTILKSKNGPRTYALEFRYPKHGGIGEISRMLEKEIKENGGEVMLNCKITGLNMKDNLVKEVVYSRDSREYELDAEMFISTIPVTNLIKSFKSYVPDTVLDSATKLRFKACIFVYIALNKKEISDNTWIYFPEKNILANRINEVGKFSANNAPPNNTLLCIDLTCDYKDEKWCMSDEELIDRCISDFEAIGLFNRDSVVDAFVERENYTYPLYDLNYRENIRRVLNFLNKIRNLKTIGRNGLFRYNNMDHSMEMGILTAQKIVADEQGKVDKIIDEIIVEEEYLG